MIKYGVKIWNYKGKDVHGWCDWSPFSFTKPWSEDINKAYEVMRRVYGYSSYQYTVEEYKGEKQ
jgi:hypothetical protein